MPDNSAGSLYYDLSGRDEKLDGDLRAAEQKVEASGKRAGQAFEMPLTSATAKVGQGIGKLSERLNSLSGRGPAELAEQLDRAEREARQALDAISKIDREKLSPEQAQKYADALTEIHVEADQTRADLKQLQAADPKFNTEALNRAAQNIDKVGDEAKGSAAELQRLAKGDTGLEGVSRAAKSAAKDVDSIGGAAGRVREGIGKIGAALAAVGIGVGLASVLTFFNGAIGAASDLNETVNKTQVVFGDASGAVLQMGEDSATALGMSRNEALGAAATYGNLFRALDLTEQQSAKMSTTLVQLAADLASFNNADPSEVLEALRSGLVGETEPLRKFGININDARLRTEALNLGLKVGPGILDANVKAQAAYSLMLQDTTLAQGDYARTADGLANTQRSNAAMWQDTLARIGDALLPVSLQLQQFARDVMPAVGDSIVTLIQVSGPLVGLLANMATRWLQLAQVAVPLAAIAIGVKLVTALKAASTEFKVTELSAKAMWAAIAFGIPILIDAVNAASDWISDLTVGKKTMDAGREAADRWGTSVAEAVIVQKAFAEISDRTGVSVGLLTKQFEEALDAGMSWTDALNDLQDGQLNTGHGADDLTTALGRQRVAFADLEEAARAAAEAAQITGEEATAALQEAADKANAVVSGGPGRWAATLSDGSVIFASSAAALADAIPREQQRAQDEAKEIAKHTPYEIAKSFDEGQDAVYQAALALADQQHAAQDDALELTQKKNELASDDLRKQLKDKNPATRAAAQQHVNQLKDEIFALEAKLDPAAALASDVLRKKLESADPQTRRKAEALATALQDAIDAQLPDTQRKADEMGLTMPDALEAHRQAARTAALQVAGAAHAALEERLPGFRTAGNAAGSSYVDGIDGNRKPAERAGGRVVGAAKGAMYISGYEWGAHLGDTFAAGLRSSGDVIASKASQLAGIAGRYLQGASPPPEGPLHTIDVDAMKVGEAWAGGWLLSIPAVKRRVSELAGAASDALSTAGRVYTGAAGLGPLSMTPMPASAVLSGAGGPDAFAGGRGASAAGTVVNNYTNEFHVYTQGPTPVETDEDLKRLMDRVLFIGDRGMVLNG